MNHAAATQARGFSRRLDVDGEGNAFALRSAQAKDIHVLLVERDLNVLRSTKRRLQQLGCEVTAVDRLSEALQSLAGEQSFNLLFVDVMIDGRPDGLLFARNVATQYPYLPIVLTSGHIEPDAESLPASCLAFLAKPYRRDQLLKVLDHIRSDKRKNLSKI